MGSKYDEVMRRVAHQWRQPLSEINSIVLVISSILDEKGIRDELLDEKLSEIEVLTKYMSNTIDDFNNIYSDIKIHEPFYISSIINELVYIVGSNLKRNGVELIINMEKPFQYTGSPGVLLQVLLVIINNAKDALKERNVFNAKINLVVSEDEKYHTIEIYDNAGGMTQKMMQKIFDMEYSTKHRSQSSGIGLNMAKSIIERNFDGDICVRNFGEGSCFLVRLKKEISA